MKNQDELMVCYQVLDAVIIAPDLELTEVEEQTLEAAKVIMAKQYMHNAMRRVRPDDCEIPFVDKQFLSNIMQYNRAARDAVKADISDASFMEQLHKCYEKLDREIVDKTED